MVVASIIDNRTPKQRQKAKMDPGMVCTLCQEAFGRDENILNSGGQVWHEACFV